MAIAGLVTGYIGTLMTLGFAGLMIYGMLEDTKVTGKPEDLFPLPESGRITLPDLVGGELMEGTRVKIYEASASGGAPGGGTRFRILVPVGEHAAGALPCVLVAPAGSDLLSGMDLDEGDYFDETLPYAEAGMVVVSFSIDGPGGENESEAYQDFRHAGAGVANGWYAYQFASQKLPFVNPDRIFSAGHSSAGTLSLLLAAHLPGLAGSVAYAPACNLTTHFKEILDNPFTSFSYPRLEVFVKRASPLTHAAKTKVPVFVFGARDDDKVTSDEWRNYARAVEDAGGNAEVKTVPEGGHYQSMIDDGIPAGIEWIRARL